MEEKYIKKIKKIEELKKVDTDAYNYYKEDKRIKEHGDLFEKVFFDDDLVDKIIGENIHFIIGEKGAGKTAYAVNISNKNDREYCGVIQLVSSTIYEKFIFMKKDGLLNMSTYKDVWVNILLLTICQELNKLSTGFMNYIRNIIFINKFKSLKKEFDAVAFKPEFVKAFEYINSYNNTGKFAIGLPGTGVKLDDSKSKKLSSVDKNYEINLMNLQKKFEDVLLSHKSKKELLIFIDGLDARPANISESDYRDCIEGLATAVVNLNNSFLKKIKVKLRLLIRPDLLYTLSLHNTNQLIHNNSVVLNWCTSYESYRESPIFKIADLFFSKQQEESFETGECWDLYFPYEVDKRHSFLNVLNYSFYKPRDIITICNLLISKCKGEKFKKGDLLEIGKEYSEYIKGELKDYMLVYINSTQYELFEKFIKSFCYKQFTYEEYVEKYNIFKSELNESAIPNFMSDKDKLLQTMYDVNLICQVTYQYNGRSIMRWSYKERGYSNIRPSVSLHSHYQFHTAYARAYRLKEDPKRKPPL